MPTATLKSPRLVIIGYGNHDINRYPDGTEQHCVGGGGYFASLAASLTIEDVGLVTRVGPEFDLAPLRDRVITDAVVVDQNGSTALSIQTYHDLDDLSNRSVELHPGVNPRISPADIPSSWIAGSIVVFVSTMVPTQQSVFVDYLREQRAANSLDRTIELNGKELQLPLIALDTDLCWLQESASIETVRSTMVKVDIAFMNRAESKILADLFDSVPVILAKKDSEGADLYLGGEHHHSHPAPQVTVVDVTGAGDTFAGTFLASLIETSDVKSALAKATERASQAVMCEGIQHLFKN